MCLRPPDRSGQLPQSHVPLREREREGAEVAEETFPSSVLVPSTQDWIQGLRKKEKERKRKRKERKKKTGRSPSILTKVSAPLP